MSDPTATRMPITIGSARNLRGEITVPGDKALSHRAVIFNSIGEGTAAASPTFCRAKIVFRVSPVCASLESRLSLDEAARTVVLEGKGLRGLEEAGDVLNAVTAARPCGSWPVCSAVYLFNRS